MQGYAHSHPDTDILLFEPDHRDRELFLANTFDYSQRRRLAEHAYRHTRAQLLAQQARLGPTLASHGLVLDLATLMDPGHRLLRRPPARPAPGPGAAAGLPHAHRRRAAAAGTPCSTSCSSRSPIPPLRPELSLSSARAHPDGHLGIGQAWRGDSSWRTQTPISRRRSSCACLLPMSPPPAHLAELARARSADRVRGRLMQAALKALLGPVSGARAAFPHLAALEEALGRRGTRRHGRGASALAGPDHHPAGQPAPARRLTWNCRTC